MKLNLGSGGYPFDGWTNYDVISHKGVVKHDLTKGIPLKNNTAKLIFTEHFIEHLTYDDSTFLFKECHRVLKKDGVIKIVMPDLKKIAKLYLRNDVSEMQQIGLSESNNNSFCKFFNQAMRAWGHQFLWDIDCLNETMLEVGFKIYPEGVADSLFPGNRKLPTDLNCIYFK